MTGVQTCALPIYKHNVVIPNGINSLELDCTSTNQVVAFNMAGIAVDIDAPVYTTTQTATGHDDVFATISGVVKNNSSQADSGLFNGRAAVTVDKGLKILSVEAYFTSSNGTKVTLPSNMISINKSTNVVSFTYGSDANGQSLKGDSITYTIETVAITADHADGRKYTANNEIIVSGTLISNGVKTSLRVDNAAWTKSSVSITSPPIAKPTITLTIDTDGGTYSGSTTISNLAHEASQTISIPTKTNHTFLGWEITSGIATISGNTSIQMGYTDVTIKAKWKLNTAEVTYKDVFQSTTGTILGTTKKQVIIGETADGKDIGGSEAYDAYYNGYYLVSSTSATVTENGATVYRIFEKTTAEVSYIDVVDSTAGTVLGTTKKQVIIGTKTDGNDIGSSKTEGAYYKGYTLSSTTSETVVKAGNTVYRIFKKPLINVPVRIIWDDSNDLYGIRPDSVLITLYQDGTKLSEKTVSVNDNACTFASLYKWAYGSDNLGTKVYNYTAGETIYAKYLVLQNGAYVSEDAYSIRDNTSNGEMTFTNFFRYGTGIVVPRAANALTIRADSSERDITLTRMTSTYKADGIAYSNEPCGISYQCHKDGTLAGIYAGKYEVDCKDPRGLLEDLTLSGEDMALVKEGDKWYLTINEVRKGAKGTMFPSFSQKEWIGYQMWIYKNNLLKPRR